MCNCFNEILKKVSEDLQSKSKNILDFKAEWKDEIFRFDGGLGVGLYIESSFRKIKKNGTASLNLTKNSHFIALSYCPFCGQKIEKEKNE